MSFSELKSSSGEDEVYKDGTQRVYESGPLIVI